MIVDTEDLMVSNTEFVQEPEEVTDDDQNSTEVEGGDEEEPLGPYDVLCGRTAQAFNNVGNRRFRMTVALNLKRYVTATTRQEKTLVVTSIVHIIKQECGGRFVRKLSNGKYKELEDKESREKCGHALRDMAGAMNAGGNTSLSFLPSDNGSVGSSKSKRKTKSKKEVLRQKQEGKIVSTTKSTKSTAFTATTSLVDLVRSSQSLPPPTTCLLQPIPLSQHNHNDEVGSSAFEKAFLSLWDEGLLHDWSSSMDQSRPLPMAACSS